MKILEYLRQRMRRAVSKKVKEELQDGILVMTMIYVLQIRQVWNVSDNPSTGYKISKDDFSVNRIKGKGNKTVSRQ